MIDLKAHTKYIDWKFWSLILLLAVISFFISFSASAQKVYEAGNILPVFKHAFFLILALVAAAGTQFVPSSSLRIVGRVMLLVTDVLLYCMLIPGFPLSRTINGATRWVNFGIGPNLQPSEFAKLAVVLVVADLLAQARTEQERRETFWWTLGITGATALPIMTQNLSTAVLICGIVGMLWIMARMPWRHILVTAATVVSVFVLFLLYVDCVYVLRGKTYTGPMDRASTWCSRINRSVGIGASGAEAENSKTLSLTDKNRQEILCRVAIAHGGLKGVGPGHSLENKYLPLADADCVFAILVEEYGIIGAGFVIFLYCVILARSCVKSSQYTSFSASLMVMGLALMLVCQALISMMVVVGIGPVTGQPLPLISTGGTSLLVTGITFGILLSVSREQDMQTDRISASIENSRNQVPTITLNDA